jgi:hypothetical protein
MQIGFVGCVVFCALMLSGCGLQGWMNAVIPQKEAAIGQGYIDDIRHQNFAPIEATFDPAYKGEGLRSGLQKMAGFFPKDDAKSVKTVGSNTVTFNGQTTYNFTYEYEFPHAWVLGHIYYKRSGNDIVIERMDVYPLRASLEEINAFTLRGKTPFQIGFLALAAFLAIFTIGTAIIAIRTPIPKRKWLWVVFTLLGFVQISLNWTTDELNYNPISFLLLSAGFVQQFYGPLLIQIAFPLGAVIFWLKRAGWVADAQQRDIRTLTDNSSGHETTGISNPRQD